MKTPAVRVWRPMWPTRVANLAPGCCAGALGALAVVEWRSTWWAAVGGLSIAAGAVVTVRGYTMAVAVGPNWVTVRGLVRTRNVPRNAVTSVTDTALLRWRDPAGRVRRTPLLMFMNLSHSVRSLHRYNAGVLRDLRRALRVKEYDGP